MQIKIRRVERGYLAWVTPWHGDNASWTSPEPMSQRDWSTTVVEGTSESWTPRPEDDWGPDGWKADQAMTAPYLPHACPEMRLFVDAAPWAEADELVPVGLDQRQQIFAESRSVDDRDS